MLWTDFEKLWDPWSHFDLIRRTMSRLPTQGTSDFPSVNKWVSSDSAVITTEIPGVDPEDIDIAVTGKSVTLRGSRKDDDIKDDQSYHRRERWSGEFSKAIKLPFHIETGKVTAKFRNGVLKLTLPKAETDKPRKIEIKSD